MITYLKIVVIVLGVMIAAGVAVIGVKLAEKSDELAERSGDAAGAAEEATAAPARRGLGLPAGAQVRRMAVGEGRLVLAVAVPGTGERIVIVDLRDGRMVAAIALEGMR